MPAYYTKKYKKFKAKGIQMKSTLYHKTVLLFGKYQGISINKIRLKDILYYNWLCRTFNIIS